jgi:F-box protein 11
MLNFLFTSPLVEHLSPGNLLLEGRYTIEQVLGQGGFGITYLGNDSKQQCCVAIKEFFPSDWVIRQGRQVSLKSSTQPADYQQGKQRFIEEAYALSRFNHPSIVKVYKVFEENNTAYIVMEFLNGKTLQKLLEEQGKLPEKQAINYIKKVGEALTVVHQANLLHKDIKPDNIMVTNDGRVVLIDFGAARSFIADKTQQMTIIFTPGYAAPEQYASRARVGPYTDIYALGATLYHLLTGQRPVDVQNRQLAGVELRSVRQLNPEVSGTVAQAVMQAIALNPEQRPQSVKDFIGKLVSASPIVVFFKNLWIVVRWLFAAFLSLISLGLISEPSSRTAGIMLFLMSQAFFPQSVLLDGDLEPAPFWLLSLWVILFLFLSIALSPASMP